MSSRQIAQGLLLAVGLSILVLLMLPVVHCPCIVVHGPTTALRAQRSAILLIVMMRAAAFLFVGMLAAMVFRAASRTDSLRVFSMNALSLSCALRC